MVRVSLQLDQSNIRQALIASLTRDTYEEKRELVLRGILEFQYLRVPHNTISPFVGLSIVPIILSSEVFPPPDWPNNTTKSPRLISSVTPLQRLNGYISYNKNDGNPATSAQELLPHQGDKSYVHYGCGLSHRLCLSTKAFTTRFYRYLHRDFDIPILLPHP